MPASSQVPLELQAVLGDRYELVREIGRGGMATVYLARDLRFERDVAVKFLNPELAAAVGVDRFRREIKVAAQLSHAHILPVFDSGAVDGRFYYVTPYVAGQSLRVALDRAKQLAIEDAVRITCEIADGLDYAHRRGFIHRDIKPENILVEDGHALLADFGIARSITPAPGDEPLTHSGVTLGTAAYMSPEQAAAQRELDGRSDVYALACVLYEMLAGHPPFVAATMSAVMARHALEPPPPLSVVRNTVPPAMEDVVLQALSKSPADRFATAGEFADALTAAALSEPSTSRGLTGGNTVRIHRALARRRRRRRQFAIAAAAVVVLGASAAAARRYLPSRSRAGIVDAAQAKQVAVLYFADLSRGKLGYLADALTESLVQALRQTRQLDVVSSNGVAGFRGESVSADSVARVLHVGSVVQGSVEEVGNGKLHVTVRLIDGQSGVDLDRASFDRPEAEVLGLRDTLAGEVARFLRRRIGDEIHLRQTQAGTTNALAWTLLQRGERARKDVEALLRAGQGAAANGRAREADSLFDAASTLDEKWSEPAVRRAGLAFSRARVEKEPLQAARLIDDGMRDADRALASDRDNADALEIRGALTYLRWLRHLARTPAEQTQLLARAESDLRRAVVVNPAQANAWNLLSHLYTQKPDVVEAKIAATRAYEEDAYLVAAPDILWRLYTVSYDLEQFPDALKWCGEGRRRFPANPRFVQCRLWLMTAKATHPDPAAAWALADTLRRLTSADEWSSEQRIAAMLVAAALANSGRLDSARHMLDRAHPPPQADPDGEIISQEAFIRTLAADKDGALRLIKQYLALKPEHRQGLAESQSWWWRNLRADPRFTAMVGSPR